MARDHHKTLEVQYLFETRFSRERARCWTIHQAHFVRNRRDCWALAMGQAPLDVKREIWLHEQDELISDPRAGGEDHYTLTTKKRPSFWASVRARSMKPNYIPLLQRHLKHGCIWAKKTGCNRLSRFRWWKRSTQTRSFRRVVSRTNPGRG